jgi:hypothetical protein
MGRALNLWLALNGISTWTPNTTGRRLNDRAGKHRTREGKTYNRLKSGVAKLSGIRLTSEFRQRLDEAPRDRDGQPVPTKHSSGVSGEEDAP